MRLTYVTEAMKLDLNVTLIKIERRGCSVVYPLSVTRVSHYLRSRSPTSSKPSILLLRLSSPPCNPLSVYHRSSYDAFIFQTQYNHLYNIHISSLPQFLSCLKYKDVKRISQANPSQPSAALISKSSDPLPHLHNSPPDHAVSRRLCPREHSERPTNLLLQDL